MKTARARKTFSAAAIVAAALTACSSTNPSCSPHERGQLLIYFEEGTEARTMQDVVAAVRQKAPKTVASIAIPSEGAPSPAGIGLASDASDAAVEEVKKLLGESDGVERVEAGPCPPDDQES